MFKIKECMYITILLVVAKLVSFVGFIFCNSASESEPLSHVERYVLKQVCSTESKNTYSVEQILHL